jgi:hypothetical protein
MRAAARTITAERPTSNGSKAARSISALGTDASRMSAAGFCGGANQHETQRIVLPPVLDNVRFQLIAKLMASC